MPPVAAYRHRCAVLNLSSNTPDGFGGYTSGYVPADPPEVDASIQAASTRDLERSTAGTVVASATHLIRCRYRPDIYQTTRLEFEARTFEVQSVANVDERDIALVLVCSEILGTGAPVGARTPRPPSRAAYVPGPDRMTGNA